MSAYVYLPHVSDPFVPHATMLEVTVVGDSICLAVVEYTEGNPKVSFTEVEGSHFMVDKASLIRAIQVGEEQERSYDRNKRNGLHDSRFGQDFPSGEDG